MGANEFVTKFNKCREQGYHAILYDEAGDFAKRGALSMVNKMIIRRFETIRSSKIMVFMSLPLFYSLDAALFDYSIVQGLVHTYGKKQTLNYGNYKTYDAVGVDWLNYWIYEKLKKPERYKAFNIVLPNFMGHFKDLSPKRAEQLEILSNKAKDRESFKALIKAEGLVSIPGLSDKFGKSVNSIRQILLKLKIKPTRRIKHANYYSNDLMPRIEEHINNMRKYDY